MVGIDESLAIVFACIPYNKRFINCTARHAQDAGSQIVFRRPLLKCLSPLFGHPLIPPLPNSKHDTSCRHVRVAGSIMGTTQDHRRHAEECVAMAQRSDDDGDKALWLTLAQSWVRLAEHVARGPAYAEGEAVEIAEIGSAGEE